jgi:hypothetical protein
MPNTCPVAATSAPARILPTPSSAPPGTARARATTAHVREGTSRATTALRGMTAEPRAERPRVVEEVLRHVLRDA